jgi:hypothetical protein
VKPTRRSFSGLLSRERPSAGPLIHSRSSAPREETHRAIALPLDPATSAGASPVSLGMDELFRTLKIRDADCTARCLDSAAIERLTLETVEHSSPTSQRNACSRRSSLVCLAARFVGAWAWYYSDHSANAGVVVFTIPPRELNYEFTTGFGKSKA